MHADVFKAILSMDAYNRGRRQGIKVAGNLLGLAELQDDSDFVLSEAGLSTGFFATSYIWNGQLVISFRGTDPESGSEFIKDVTHGWPLGAGNNNADQAQQAIEFYKDIVGVNSLSDIPITSVFLTGHSLGGGFAGFMASLTNQSNSSAIVSGRQD